MAYAVIDIGGKQYRVEEGDSVLVDRVGEDAGAKVSPRALLFADGKNSVLEGADLGKVKVEAVVAEHVRGPKLRVNTYRPKKRHRRRMGHRSELTRLEIRKIRGPSAGKPADGSKAGAGKPADGSRAGRGKPADGSKAGRGKPAEGSKAGAGKPADGSRAGRSQRSTAKKQPAKKEGKAD